MDNKVITVNKCTKEERQACTHGLSDKSYEEVAICEMGIPSGCPKLDCKPEIVCPFNYSQTKYLNEKGEVNNENWVKAEVHFDCSKCIGPDEIAKQLASSRPAAEKLAEKLGE